MPNFNKNINRIKTHSSKYDTIEQLFGISPKEGLAMWTADMDFKSPRCVVKTIREYAKHGIFGYFGDYNDYYRATIAWYYKRHGWKIQSDWIAVTHGLVAAIGIIIRAFSKPGDEVIVFTPVYHSFAKMIKNNQRVVKESVLKETYGKYELNLDELNKRMTGNEKILLFCSPHNPGGRVWNAEELRQVGSFCKKHNLILVSDEIHNDILFPGAKHYVFPLAVPEIIDRLIVLVSSTKTFNIAGGLMGNVIIQNAEIRKLFNKSHRATGNTPNSLGMLMAESAYRYGEPWLDQLLVYLNRNRILFDTEVNKIPGLKSMKLSATYLAWLNFADTGMSEEEIIRRVHKKAKIAANVGSTFGTGGETYMRFNLACPKNIVIESINRLKFAFDDLQ